MYEMDTNKKYTMVMGTWYDWEKQEVSSVWKVLKRFHKVFVKSWNKCNIQLFKLKYHHFLTKTWILSIQLNLLFYTDLLKCYKCLYFINQEVAKYRPKARSSQPICLFIINGYFAVVSYLSSITETMWLANLQLFTLWSLMVNVCWLLYPLH